MHASFFFFEVLILVPEKHDRFTLKNNNNNILTDDNIFNLVQGTHLCVSFCVSQQNSGMYNHF